MLPIRDDFFSRERPYVTYTLIGLNLLIYLWDRGGSLFGPSVAFSDLAMRPAEVTLWLSGGGQGDPMELAKVFTSMFLHANLAHLLGNLIFLFAFGPNVENALGGWRYMLFYLFWGVMAAAAQIFVDPTSRIQMLGASGAIGGVLGAYFFLFPGARIKVLIPPIFWHLFTLPAWVLLGLWFVFQILLPQEGVANWAHAGGFLAGMLTVLVMGGRQKVLEGRRFERDEEFESA